MQLRFRDCLSRAFVSTVLLLLAAPSISASKPSLEARQELIFSPTTWYRLRTSLDGYALDVIAANDTSDQGLLRMAEERRYTGQYWQIKTRGDGSFFIRNLFMGADKHLDVDGANKRNPHLAAAADAAGNFSGQRWSMAAWDDGSYSLSNEFSGPDLVLDADGAGVALSEWNETRLTERWSITPMGKITQAQFLD